MIGKIGGRASPRLRSSTCRDDGDDQMSPVYESDQEEEEETGSSFDCHCKSRPLSTKLSLVVNATEGFLTIHDYVSVVYS
jgi:hypothetical protein